MLHLVLDDKDRRWAAVRVETDAPLPTTDLTLDGTRWSLDVVPPPLARIEYRFSVTAWDGGSELICDPANPLRVGTAFGDRSVLQLPGYEPPWWLDAPVVPARRQTLRVPGETEHPVPVTVWSPRESGRSERLPLLVVHDGEEYDRLAGITRYTGALIAAGRVPPHRVALLHPLQRDEWYSASPEYIRSLTGPVVGSLKGRLATGPVVVMGASLGGLVSLVSAVRHPSMFAGVFSQSGSFFSPLKDVQESAYQYFSRITDTVADVLQSPAADSSQRIGLTCGALEENVGNNREMAAALRRAGHRVTFAEVPDLHNYTAWRDALDPHLTAVLQDCWA